MTRISFMLGLLLSLNVITGCDIIKTEKDELLFNKLDELQLQVEQEKWNEAFFLLDEFMIYYEKRKWKLQLLGNLDDYKNIELEIELFKESIQEEDGLESKQGLSHIKYRLSNIYNL